MRNWTSSCESEGAEGTWSLPPYWWSAFKHLGGRIPVQLIAHAILARSWERRRRWRQKRSAISQNATALNAKTPMPTHTIVMVMAAVAGP
jgi:hypothetical protein